MNATEIINELRAIDVKIQLDGDTLKLDGPKGALSEKLLLDLKAAKPEIIELLRVNNRPKAGTAAAPVVVHGGSFTNCLMDQCGGVVREKAGLYCCLRCLCWYRLEVGNVYQSNT